MSWNRGQYFGGKKDGCADHSGRRHEPSVVEDESQLPEHERCGNMHALSFASICARLDRAEAPGPQSAKHGLVFDRELLKAAGKQSLYPVVRLLCTSLDVGRRNFGLKEKGLAQLYLQLTGLKGADPAKNKAAGKLHFFAGTASARGTHMGAELGAALVEVLKGRVPPHGDMTLGEVHDFLDQLARMTKSETKRTIFEKVYTRLSPREHKWLARVIIGNLKLGGLGDNTIFKHLHRSAKDRYAECQNLKKVCAEYAVGGPGHNAAATPAGRVEPGESFKPMLAHGEPNVDDQATHTVRELQRVAKKRFGIEGVPPITCEVKLDGERIMAHLVNGEIRLWTRSPTDYTSHYGPCISETLLKCLQGCDAAILDGECLAVCTQTGECVRFGSNQTCSRVERELKSRGLPTVHFDPNDEHVVKSIEESVAQMNDSTVDAEQIKTARMVFVCFDALYLSGEGAEELLGEDDAGKKIKPGALGHLPLKIRRRIAERITRREDAAFRRIRMVEHINITDTEDKKRIDQLHAFYDQVVSRGGEGVVVKLLDSPYILGERSRATRAWIKLKPEYGADGDIPRLDYLIVAGNWSDAATGGRTGRLSKYTVAARCPHTGRFYAVGRVGTGYGFARVKEIHEKLKGNLDNYDQKSRPDWLDGGWHPKPDNRPDLIVRDPSKSLVLEIKCAELVVSTEYGSVGRTFRFPRVERVREDKGADDVSTLDEVRRVAERKRTVAKIGGGGAGGKKKKKKITRKQADGVRRDQLVDVEALEELRQASTKPKVFKKDEFLALPSARCGDLDRPALLQLIAEAGGVVRSAAPDEFDPDAPRTISGAAGDGRLLMVTAYASTGYAVLDAAWCAECVAAGARLAPAPRHYLATPPPQKLEELRQTFEPVWGLPRFRAPSVDELRTCAAHARAHRGGHWFYDDAVVDEAPDTDAALAAHGVTPLSRVLRPARVAVAPETACLASRLRLYGATVVAPDAATHVLADVWAAAPPANGAPVVNRAWLDDCVVQRRVVPVVQERHAPPLFLAAPVVPRPASPPPVAAAAEPESDEDSFA